MESKHGTKFEEEIGDICDQNEPDKTRNLADVVNDQLHDIRDEELKESLERSLNLDM
jgi:hypothetical protein